MAAIAEKLTLREFQSRYEQGDRSYEYWQGEAMPKGMPTSTHGLLQIIIAHLLMEAGFIAAAEVELRIVPGAHPKPDLIGSHAELEVPYPTKALDVVVEILSEDDSAPYLLEKCGAYGIWGFEYIYVVNPESRQLFRWTQSALSLTDWLTTIPATRIWEELDKSLRRKLQDG